MKEEVKNAEPFMRVIINIGLEMNKIRNKE
jgi:hypothetical protein